MKVDFLPWRFGRRQGQIELGASEFFMCGIVGIIGREQVAPLLVDALKRLEYRGYDLRA